MEKQHIGNMMTRRRLLMYAALLLSWYPFARRGSWAAIDGEMTRLYPLTIDILKDAYRTEMVANRYYIACSQKALAEDYQNIAYLFHSLSFSEIIHAENYQRLIASLGSAIEISDFPVSIADTKSNLNTAAKNEMKKIKEFYPEILNRLSTEAHEQATIYCMYSLKSHQQHEKIILDIRKYSGSFFRLLAKKIESKNPNYYICEICGSTVDEKPDAPCEICNYPTYHYQKIERPLYSEN